MFSLSFHRLPPSENNQNNFGTFSVKTANSFSANFNEEQVVGRRSIIDSATSPFETAAGSAGNRPNIHSNNSSSNNNNNGGSSMAATLDRDASERRHLEDVTNHTNSASTGHNNNSMHHYNNNSNSGDGYGSETENQRKAKLVIGTDVSNLDPVSGADVVMFVSVKRDVEFCRGSIRVTNWFG